MQHPVDSHEFPVGDAGDPADSAAFQQFLHLPVERHEAEHIADTHLDALSPGRGGHLEALFIRLGHRFLQQDIPSSFYGFQCLGMVETVRRTDDHTVTGFPEVFEKDI